MPFTQDRFLSLQSNKQSFISTLSEFLVEAGITVRTCRGDADCTIVKEALNKATTQQNPVLVVADDTDISVLLLNHWKAHIQDVYLLSCADPLEWDWELKENMLIPKPSTLEIAPPELSRIIRCGCSMNTERPCSPSTCSCRKLGLPCMLSCRSCHGEECLNVRVSTKLS